jgi:predicted lipoprotein with Yx(FWY)xxD motif
VLKSPQGKTLYYLTADSPQQATCTGTCAQLWPPLLAPAGAPTGVSLPNALGAVDGPNGHQVTYNGHPLYTYSKDTSASDALGQGFGGVWFVATPDVAPAGTPSNGYGY